MKELRKHYWKAFLALIKAYKRYYLGAWIIKLPFYKLTSNQHKFTKWQAKRDERLEFLHNALKTFKFFSAFDEESKKWLDSSEFKTKYLDTKHPYPPLLNPNSIDYKSIPAELAWELNLPLPPKYDLLTIANVCCCSLATTMFLREVNYVCIMGETFKELYVKIYTYNNHRKNHIFFYYQLFCIWDKDNALKFKKMLTHKVPLLFVVRCPISHIRSEINHPSNNYIKAINRVKTFNLTYKNNIDQLIPKVTYRWGYGFKPSFNFLSNPTKENLLDRTDSFISIESVLAKDSMLEAFRDNISSIYCIEFNDLKADKAFDTFSKIADTFNFKKPKNKDFFTNKQWTEIYTLLPTTLYVHQDDLEIEKPNLSSCKKRDSIQIIITLPSHLTELQKDFIDISSILEESLIIDETKILIMIEREHFFKIKKNNKLYSAIIKFLTEYVDAIKIEVDRRKDSKITEEQILDFLKSNHKIRTKIKNILDKETNWIKTCYPDFIEKWKYYNEFEKMCAELDKKE